MGMRDGGNSFRIWGFFWGPKLRVGMVAYIGEHIKYH